MVVSSQDQEVITIMGSAIFGWSAKDLPDDVQGIGEAIMKALHDKGYVITKVEPPLAPDAL